MMRCKFKARRRTDRVDTLSKMKTVEGKAYLQVNSFDLVLFSLHLDYAISCVLLSYVLYMYSFHVTF